MKSSGNSFNYFPKNKLTRLANFVQFIRMLMFCLEDWGAWAPARLLATPLWRHAAIWRHYAGYERSYKPTES